LQTLPIDPCAIASDPKSRFSSIVSTGLTGGTGTINVSFSGFAFAALPPINPPITYGPYSTPNSVAAQTAALVTKNYARYGLVAKALGPNVIYSGTSDLGTVSINGGSSFGTDNSSTAATAVANACYAIAASLPCKGQLGFFDYNTARTYYRGTPKEIVETPRQHIIRRHIANTASAGTTIYANPNGAGVDAMFFRVVLWNQRTYWGAIGVPSGNDLVYIDTFTPAPSNGNDVVGYDLYGNELHTNKLILSSDHCSAINSFPISP
jgi:hypothetical protein